ncbi:GNAT family N-acetyltransferase [Alteromonas sp. 5E99-2]|uniref:GNAT family N-acetyltransferase n=1 Tax=Alteromonas sp. 5E99-2 TaxID=2817683 RepID=UPI001A98D4A2|nr:GNAT family N-acetyltransferase [Alteromonas sp. 5E99-2]MBO1254415.1 GNAT family N-acetyltransferase [Alteromonas sp. 5E99-2]
MSSSIPWGEIIKSGDRIFLGSNAGVPNALIDSLIAYKGHLEDIEVTHINTLSDERWANIEYRHRFKVNTFFIYGDVIRQAVDEGRADYTPCFLSEVSSLFTDDILPLDAALIMVGPPDDQGYCSLGVSVDVVMSAVRSAKRVIAQINPSMPRTSGHSFLHISEFAAVITENQALPELLPAPSSSILERIGQYTALLIENGATLQIGIGKVPDAVLGALVNHQDLGVHSEMITDGMIDLIKSGVINNRKKTFHPGKCVVSFCIGSQRLYDFVHNNAHVEFYPSSYVNKPTNIAKNDNLIAINSALEVDLTGQVVADSIGYDFYSGIGGQVDFISGANISKGGKPIIALPSTAKNGTVSRIVATITEGSGVVTSRGNVNYVVTEFGIASLKGKSIRERALELIRVAHPKFREELLNTVRTHYWVPDYQKKAPTEIPEFGELQVKTLTFKHEEYYLRPLNPSDERILQEFFYSHTKETLRLRYNHVPQRMSRENSYELVSVDQTKDLALTIVSTKASKFKIQAVGRYYLNANNTCELAFVTRESQQGKGMATYLLSQLIDIAKQRGLDKMFAYVRPDNKAMITVFEQFYFKRLMSADHQEVELCLDLKDN